MSAGGSPPQSLPSSARFIFQTDGRVTVKTAPAVGQDPQLRTLPGDLRHGIQHAGGHHAGPGQVDLIHDHQGIDLLGLLRGPRQ